MTDYRLEAPPIIKDFLHFEKNIDHSDGTIEEYFLDLRTFFRFMKQERGIAPADTPFDEIPIGDIDIDFIKGISKIDINNYISYLRSDRAVNEGTPTETRGLSPATTQRKIACLKSFFGFLCETMGTLQANPTHGVVVPRTKKTLPQFLTLKESNQLLDSVKGINEERDYCILLLMLTCGLRISEVRGINISDLRLDPEESFLRIVGKGRKERQVYLNEACIESIKDYLNVREEKYKPDELYKDALFLSRKHARIGVATIQDLVEKHIKTAGLPPRSPHKLRHTAATLMLQNGVDVRTLQTVLGHKNLNTTQIYTHVNEESLRVASRANPLSRRCAKCTKTDTKNDA